MSESFLGEIRIFAGSYAPVNWAICDGQLLGVAQNQALFSLLGTLYGGDGHTSFGLPDFRGRIPLHFGSGPPIAGPPLTNRPLGSQAGEPTVVLTDAEMPNHNHPMQGSTNTANLTTPSTTVLAKVDGVFYEPETEGDKLQDFPDDTVGNTGKGLEHQNHMATLSVNYIISLKGTYPPRS